VPQATALLRAPHLPLPTFISSWFT